MNKYYFTFGGYNHEELYDYCVMIESISVQEARKTMFSFFKDNWAFVYPEQPKEEVMNMLEALVLHKKANN
jgi:hypothetical protein